MKYLPHRRASYCALVFLLLFIYHSLESQNITCPVDIQINTDGMCGAFVNYDDPDVILPFENPILIDGLASGSLFPIGSTTQTYQASDASGNVVSCSFDVTVIDNSPDSDCDGVGDACDVCDGGDDSIDADGDGQPDCLNLPTIIDPSWNCSNNPNKKKYFICHKPQQQRRTLCVSENSLPAHMAHGDFLGPCTSCSSNRLAKSDDDMVIENEAHLNVYPNPATDLLQIDIEGLRIGDASLQIVNTFGQNIWEESIFIPSSSEHLELNLDSRYNNGIYLIIIRQSNLTLTKTVMIMKP